MEAELDGFRQSRSRSAGGSGLQGSSAQGPASAVDGKVERAGAAFDRVMKKAGGVPGPTAAADRKSATQLAELDELARKNRIKERLAQLKAEASE